MQYWWVNQNQTYKTEVPGGFLWSPKTRSDGGRNQFYENMKEVLAGDVIFSFCDTRIKAIGIATGSAQTAPKPDFGATGMNWSLEGWLVPVEFQEVSKPIRPKDHMDSLRPHLPSKYSPLQKTGDGLQSVYLASVPETMANELIRLLGPQYQSCVDKFDQPILEDIETSIEISVGARTDIGPTEIEQLVKARRGQGIFKANVRLNEQSCRLTGTIDPRHLRASHIKPWKDCTDEEKLHGCNGLLLAPHVDHLFDGGWISFESDGTLLLSKKLDPSVLAQWHIQSDKNVGPFSGKQCEFLAYHRRAVFKG